MKEYLINDGDDKGKNLTWFIKANTKGNILDILRREPKIYFKFVINKLLEQKERFRYLYIIVWIVIFIIWTVILISYSTVLKEKQSVLNLFVYINNIHKS